MTAYHDEHENEYDLRAKAMALDTKALEAVKVKPLEWSADGEEWNAPGYRIERGDNGRRFYIRSNKAAGLFATIEFAETLDAAKAAAQSNHEAGILSALDLSATPSRNDILEEAAMVADEYADEQAQEIAAAIRALVKPEEQPPMNNPNPYRGW